MVGNYVAWPSWHPDQELRADDLCRLELYVLARSSIMDQTFGVHTLDLDRSLSFTEEGDTLHVSLSDIRAICPSGHPIVLSGRDESIATAVRYPEQSVAIEVDLVVEVNARAASNPVSEPPAKYTLEATIVTPGASASAPSYEENSLYIGRFEVPRKAPEEASLVLPPPVFRLAALAGAPSRWDWDAWTAPLMYRIRELLQLLSDLSAAGGRLQAAAAEAFWLSAVWPQISAHDLTLRLQILSRLLSAGDDDVSPLIALKVLAQNGANPAEIPSQLADLIDLRSVVLPKGYRLDLMRARFIRLERGPGKLIVAAERELPAGVWEVALPSQAAPQRLRLPETEKRFALIQPRPVGSTSLYTIGPMPLYRVGEGFVIEADAIDFRDVDVRLFLTRSDERLG